MGIVADAFKARIEELRERDLQTMAKLQADLAKLKQTAEDLSKLIDKE